MAIGIAAAVAVGWFGRHWSFFLDEWGTILYRRSGGLDAFFAPHNGHLQAIVIGVYRALFSVFGLHSYTPYLWTGIAFQLLSGAAFFAYARRRLQPELAVLLLIPLLFMAYAWEALFWLFTIGFVIGIAAFIAILLVRDADWRRGDPIVAALLALALASSGLGVAITAGVALDVLLRREPLRRLWPVALPAGLYTAWFLLYRRSAETPAMLRDLPGAAPHGDIGELHAWAGQLDQVPGFVRELAESAANGVIGIDPSTPGGIALVALCLALGTLVVLRQRITPRLVALLGTLAVFWLTTGFTRADLGAPDASRYIYPAGALILLLAVEAMAGLRLRHLGTAVATVAVAGILALDIAEFDRQGNYVRAAFARQEAELRSLERLRGRVAPTYAPDPERLPFVTAGTYFPAIDALGSPVGGDSRSP